MLKVNNLSKSFELDNQKITALEDISFEVEESSFFHIIGPSGCGKSTLLRIIAGLTKKSSGSMEWKEEPKIGFVFQNYALFPFLTVAENIGFGLKMSGESESKKKKIVAELIEEIGLSGYEDKHPKELSGGMKQRVGIARSLAIDPNVLLLDEPFSSLDEITAEGLRKLLLKLWEKRKMTIIMVTHLIVEAIDLSDHILVMKANPGQVKETLKNDLPRPRNLRSEKSFHLEDKLKELLGV